MQSRCYLWKNYCHVEHSLSLIAWNVSCEESKMQFVQRVEIIQLASDVRESPESEQILA